MLAILLARYRVRVDGFGMRTDIHELKEIGDDDDDESCASVFFFFFYCYHCC